MEQVFALLISLFFRGFGAGPKRASILPLVALLWLTACSTKPLTDPIIGPDHAVKNVYRKEGVLTGEMRRIAVLPISSPEVNSSAVSSRETLEPVFQAELQKSGRFELFFVTRGQLLLWTGKERWDDYDELPADFLKTVTAKTGCNGVLFARVSQYHAYPPIMIGWRMRLASSSADSIWSVDEVFDSAQAPVANSARRYDRDHERNNPVLEDSRSILLSPRKFGQYTLAAVFQTMPVR
jgi:hypothetical protein